MTYGHDGSDTYVFARGDGQDTIIDRDADQGADVDTLRFAAGILPSDITFLEVGPADLVVVSLELTIASASLISSLPPIWIMASSNSPSPTGLCGILDDILAAAAVGSAGDDVRDFGTLSATTEFLATAGDDDLAGGPGSTTYHFGIGSGRDRIMEAGTNSATDRVELAAGLDPEDHSGHTRRR